MAEAAQAEIIGLLVAQGEADVASRLAACQAARIWRSARVHRYRCRSPGCVSCWRGSLDEWWLGFRDWCRDDGNAFAVALPSDHLFAAPIARALRDLRDRQARSCSAWADVAMLGVTDGAMAYVMVSPWQIKPDVVRAALSCRWPTMSPLDARRDAPPIVTTRVRAALAVRRRGSAPLRFTIYPQGSPQQEQPTGREPIPFLVSTPPCPWLWSRPRD